MARTYELLKSSTLASPAANIQLTSISQSYTDLVLCINAAADASGQIFISNGNTTYTIGFRGINPSTSTYYVYTSVTQLAPFSNFTLTTNQAQAVQGMVNYFNYTAGAASRSQAYLSIMGTSNDNATMSASTATTNASVSTITIDANGKNFVTGTRVRLYGILRA